MGLITRIGDKAGALGTVVSAMGCAGCFPALGSLGVALGLGFLGQYEELVITRLLPLFAVVALLANGLGWFSHRQWHRSVLGMVGPAIVLAALYPFFGFGWTEWPALHGPGHHGCRLGLGSALASASQVRSGLECATTQTVKIFNLHRQAFNDPIAN